MDLTRRTLLKILSAPAVCLTPTESLSLGLSVGVKQEIDFGLREGLIYLNCGASAPSPTMACNVVRQTLSVTESDPEEHWTFAYGACESSRELLAEYFGCPVDDLWITQNTTEGMNFISQQLRLNAGERVLTTDEEHYGGVGGWLKQRELSGIEVDMVSLPRQAADPDDVVELFREKITSDTRVISISHVTWVRGFRLPVQKIGQLAREYGLRFVVDGAQAAGIFQADRDRCLYDAYAASGHKTLMAPIPSGVLVTSEEFRRELNSIDLHQGTSFYTGASGLKSSHACLGMGASLAYLMRLGNDEVAAKMAGLHQRLREHVSLIPRCQVISPEHPELRSQIVSIALDADIDASAVGDRLYAEHGIRIKVMPESYYHGLRVSMHCHNSVADIDLFADALGRTLA